ncbi:DUF2184 domain-containing protein [Agrobacterium larrymoorei]|uniref:DUF2184 domain-containing protein n=1 Tax=Agrobacterium larrymoorei TaxID=160699 RepID=UPI0030BF5D56
MNFMQMQDAPQRAFGFLIQQATRIEAEVYRTVYQEIQYQDIVPVDTTGPEWVDAITYFSSDAVGAAQWFNGHAQDVPNVELLREKFSTTVSMAAIGYRYSVEELGKAALYGLNLTSDKGVAARRVAEEKIDSVAFVGDATKGYTGTVNNPAVAATTAPADGTGSSTTFANKTPDQILRDVNGQLTGQFTGTFGNLVADTILFPYQVLLDLSTRRIDSVNQTTILEWIEKNNIYTRTTGRPLTIRGLFGYLDASGAGGTKRMVSYKKDPSVLKLNMPMPFRFWNPWQMGPMLFEVPGTFRLGGVDVKLAKGIRYLDGV